MVRGRAQASAEKDPYSEFFSVYPRPKYFINFFLNSRNNKLQTKGVYKSYSGLNLTRIYPIWSKINYAHL
jgi:hypothetical protein